MLVSFVTHDDCLSIPNISPPNSFALFYISFFKDPVETTGIGKNVTVVKGTEANISCPVAGNPQPNITWYKGSELGGVKISHGKKLTVKEKIEMSLCYVCVASNSLGKPVNITQCFTVGKPFLFEE